MIILMENESVTSRINNIYIFTVLGSIISIVIIYVISRKLSEIMIEPVEETMKKQKQFISDASHELKTPLAVIEANVDVLASQMGDSKWMQYIQSEISSMDKLINNLLFLAKTDNMDKVAIRENFDISEEVNLVSSMFESMTYEKEINVKYNIQDNIGFNGNKDDIKQVVSVLIDNAIMHTKPKGTINIELAKEKNNIIIQVKNKKQKALELMKSVGLKEEQANRRILKLSGGEQQRIAIARSLAYNPKMIIADEPTGNLDKDTENEILKIFRKPADEENKCVIIVTHSKNICDSADTVYELGKNTK